MPFSHINLHMALFLYYRITKFIFIKVNFKLKLITKTKGGIKNQQEKYLQVCFKGWKQDQLCRHHR